MREGERASDVVGARARKGDDVSIEKQKQKQKQ